MQISLSPARVAVVLVALVSWLTLLSLIGTIATYYYLGEDRLAGLVRIFNLDAEASIPTWYAAVSIVSCALLLSWIGFIKKRSEDKYAGYWLALAVIFVLISLDEITQVHELSIQHVRNFLHVQGFLYYAWIIPATLFVFTLALIYFRFWLHLPARTRVLFLLAAGLYLGGTLVVEAISGQYHWLHGTKNIVIALLTTLEEFMEMMGIVVFLSSLLDYISKDAALRQVSVSIHAAGKEQGATHFTPRLTPTMASASNENSSLPVH